MYFRDNAESIKPPVIGAVFLKEILTELEK
jgi:hypothetical protein